LKRRLLWFALLLLVALTVLASPPVQRLYYRVDHLPLILQESRQQEVSPYLVAAVIFTESRFRSEARSEVGAVGLMQLMPETAREMAARLGEESFQPSRLAQPEVNIALGVLYLKELQARFRSPEMVLAAYNAGPTLVEQWASDGGKIPYPETRSFVDSVLHHEERLRELYPEWQAGPPRERER
jgi:soluble lytic murein transglycosylase